MLQTTTVDNVNRKLSTTRLQRFSERTTLLKNERSCFIFVHFIFYLVLIVVVWIKLEQFNKKQQDFIQSLQTNFNGTSKIKTTSEQLDPSGNCSCHFLNYPRRNRTTRCVQIRVSSHDIIENVFCQNGNNRISERAWLKIQQRDSNSVDFNRSWAEYRRGFGNVRNQTDFWIGNENLHWLTNTFSCRLKIELTDWYNETRTATYETFRIGNHQDGYRIQIADYHGDIETNSLIDTFSRRHNNARFSTWDHYATNINCPQQYSGSGWWYHSGSDCAHVQLNGRLATHSDGLVPFNTGILWIGWKSDRHYSFQRVNMAIQQKSRRSRSLKHLF